MPIFEPPVAYDLPPILPTTKGVPYLLFRHFSPRARGRTVLKVAGEYVTVDTPDQFLVESATEVYLGGHIYEVSQEVADALEAAGYTTSEDPVNPSGTWGGMASFTWGEVAGYDWEDTP